MVDLVVLQSVSYVAAAIGVCIATFYYAMNLRATDRNRRIQLVSQLSQFMLSEEGMKRYFELLNMEWKNFDDFERKYGSDFNLEATAKRYASWQNYDHLGKMLKKGMINAEDAYDLTSDGVLFQWHKWESIIFELRKRYNGEEWMSGFEFLNIEMSKLRRQREPSYKVPETFGKYIPDK